MLVQCFVMVPLKHTKAIMIDKSFQNKGKTAIYSYLYKYIIPQICNKYLCMTPLINRILYTIEITIFNDVTNK